MSNEIIKVKTEINGGEYQGEMIIDCNGKYVSVDKESNTITIDDVTIFMGKMVTIKEIETYQFKELVK